MTFTTKFDIGDRVRYRITNEEFTVSEIRIQTLGFKLALIEYRSRRISGYCTSWRAERYLEKAEDTKVNS